MNVIIFLYHYRLRQSILLFPTAQKLLNVIPETKLLKRVLEE